VDIIQAAEEVAIILVGSVFIDEAIEHENRTYFLRGMQVGYFLLSSYQLF